MSRGLGTLQRQILSVIATPPADHPRFVGNLGMSRDDVLGAIFGWRWPAPGSTWTIQVPSADGWQRSNVRRAIDVLFRRGLIEATGRVHTAGSSRMRATEAGRRELARLGYVNVSSQLGANGSLTTRGPA